MLDKEQIESWGDPEKLVGGAIESSKKPLFTLQSGAMTARIFDDRIIADGMDLLEAAKDMMPDILDRADRDRRDHENRIEIARETLMNAVRYGDEDEVDHAGDAIRDLADWLDGRGQDEKKTCTCGPNEGCTDCPPDHPCPPEGEGIGRTWDGDEGTRVGGPALVGGFGAVHVPLKGGVDLASGPDQTGWFTRGHNAEVMDQACSRAFQTGKAVLIHAEYLHGQGVVFSLIEPDKTVVSSVPDGPSTMRSRQRDRRGEA